MTKKLRDLREDAGLNQERLAELLGVTQSTLSKLERGKLKLSRQMSAKLANVLNLSISELENRLQDTKDKFESNFIAPLQSTSVQSVKVVGSIGAGLWMDVSDHVDTGETVQSVAGRYAGVEQFSYKVSGNSMDLEHIFDGDYAICIPAWRGWADGSKVVVERQRGQLVERTVKRLTITPTHYEFWPRSSDPRWQTPIRVPRAEGTEFAEDGDTTIRIIGRCIGTTRIFD